MGRPSILEGFFFGGFVCGLGDDEYGGDFCLVFVDAQLGVFDFSFCVGVGVVNVYDVFIVGGDEVRVIQDAAGELFRVFDAVFSLPFHADPLAHGHFFVSDDAGEFGEFAEFLFLFGLGAVVDAG